MKCPLKEAVNNAKYEYQIDLEKVGSVSIAFICAIYGDSVNATVGREIPNGKIKVFSDSCQWKNPPQISPEPRQKRSQIPLSHDHRSKTPRLWEIICSSIPSFLRNDGSAEANQTNTRVQIRIEEDECYLSFDIRNSHGKRG